MICIDYAYKLNLYVADNSEFMHIIYDEDLEHDEYFYERKAHLKKTLKSIDSGDMKLFSEDEFMKKMDSINKELKHQYTDLSI